MPPQLKPPKNVRQTVPRCCETCTLLEWLDGGAQCKRPGGPSFDSGFRDFLITVCDRWQPISLYDQDS